MRVFHLLQQAHSALFRAADRTIRNAERITASQNAVLFVLTEKDGLPISAISEQLKMGKSSLTALIDRMAAQGLLRREQNAEDGRISNIFIEPDGTAIVKRTAGSVKEINTRLLEPFSREEQATIERFLIHVRQNANTIVAPQGVSETKNSQGA